MYFNPPQNNHNDFYHPLNQKLNEQKFTKARVMFKNASDARRDMRVAKETGLYERATEKPSGKGRVYEITFKSEGQFRRFMSQFEVDLMEYPLKESRDDFDYLDVEAARQDAKLEAPKVVKTRKGYQVMVYSRKVKKFIPQGPPHRSKAAAEKDAKMFEDVQLDETVKTAFKGRIGNRLTKPNSIGSRMLQNFRKNAKPGDGFYVIDGGGSFAVEIYRVDEMPYGDEVKKLGDSDTQNIRGKKSLVQLVAIKEDVQLDETNFRFPQPGEDYGDLAKSISDPSGRAFPDMSKAELKKRSDEVDRKFAAVMRKHKRTKVGEVLDLLDKDGGTRLYKDSDIKQIGKYLTKFKDNVRKVAHQMMIDVMEGDDYLAKKRIPVREDTEIVNFNFKNRSDAIAFGHQAKKQGLALRAKEFESQGNETSHLAVDTSKLKTIGPKLKKLAKKYMGKYSTTGGGEEIDKMMREDVQLDEATPGDTRVVTKGDQNQYERISRALTAAKKAGKIAGYEGTVFNRSKGEVTLIFDTKAHKPASERRKVAKMIKDFGLEFHHSIEEGLRQAMSGPRETESQKRKRMEKDNFDLYKKRQNRVAALRGDKSSRQLTSKQQRDYLRRVNLDQIRAMEDVDMQNVTASQLRAIKEAKVYKTLNNLRKENDNG